MREFNIFGYEVSSYWTMLVIASVLTTAMSVLRAKRYSFGKTRSEIISILLIFYGCVGAKLLFILEHPNSTFSLRGGMSLFGSVYFIPIALGITVPLVKVKYACCMDFVALYGPLIFAFMRIGCYLNGCCGGRDIAFLPPVQLIECILDIMIFFLLLFYENNKSSPGYGKQYPIFMVCYALTRFVVEFMRDTPKDIFYLSEGQWLSVITFVLGVGILYFIKAKKENYRNEVLL